MSHAGRLQGRNSSDCKRAVTRPNALGDDRKAGLATVDGSGGRDRPPNSARFRLMGYEDVKADAKETMRNVDNKAKETWRKADGEESLSDKVANAGDDMRDALGNAGDEFRRGAEDAREESERDVEDRPI
jgi:hypothetical protein